MSFAELPEAGIQSGRFEESSRSTTVETEEEDGSRGWSGNGETRLKSSVDAPVDESDIQEVSSTTYIRDKEEITTKRELYSWYLYDWANSVYYTVAISGFLPLQILRLAELYWCEKSRSISNPELCNSDLLPGLDDATVRIGAIHARPDSLTTYFISFSVLSQAIVFIILGPIADFGCLRHRLLISFGTLGALSTCTLYFISNPSDWWLAGVVAIISNTCIGASIVFYNAYMPLLVDNHPEVVNALPDDENVLYGESDDEDDEEEKGVMNTPKSDYDNQNRNHQRTLTKEIVANRISSTGILFGYTSGMLLILICAGIAISGALGDGGDSAKGDTLVYRFSNLLTGLWWLFFGTVAFSGFKVRPAKTQLPKRHRLKTIFTLGPRSIGQMLMKSFRKLPNSFYMLIAWFFYSDGINTIAAVGSIFAAKELNMSGGELSIVLAEVPFFAAIGNYVFQKIYERFRTKRTGKNQKELTPKAMIEWILIIFLPLPIYTIIGFIPGLPFGMKHKFEMYIFGMWYGLVLGPVNAFSRGLFMELIPSSEESRWFALYEITDKGSSWIGPLLAGLIANLGSMRYAMVVVITSILFGWYFLRKVNLENGRKQAKIYADNIGAIGNNNFLVEIDSFVFDKGAEMSSI